MARACGQDRGEAGAAHDLWRVRWLLPRCRLSGQISSRSAVVSAPSGSAALELPQHGAYVDQVDDPGHDPGEVEDVDRVPEQHVRGHAEAEDDQPGLLGELVAGDVRLAAVGHGVDER